MTVTFTLDGRTVHAAPGQTIWQAARDADVTLPHLCYRDAPGYRADGNCRACMVEIEGERVLAASCKREVAQGMVVRTASGRAARARATVFELLCADQPAEAPDSPLRRQAEAAGITTSRFPAAGSRPAPDASHPAIAVNLAACIQCTLCLRACREVQVNGVIGMAGHGAGAKIIFDLDDPMGQSSCVGCGECVEACPTGALLPAGADSPERTIDSLCPYCGVGCQVTYGVRDDRIVTVTGRNGPANEGRLCIKGRFGFDYTRHPHRLTRPLIRKQGVAKADSAVDPANPASHFREASWDEALDVAAAGLRRLRERHGGGALAGFGSAKGSNEEAYLFQKLVRTGFGTNNVDHCTRLCHASSVAALMEGIGSGAVTAPFREALNAEVIIVTGSNPSANHPVAATYIKNAAQADARLIVIDPRGQALKQHAHLMLQQKPGSDVALLNAMMQVIIAEDLVNRDYIERYTEGFDALRNHLTAFTPEAMAPICGIAPEDIRAAARTYGKARRAIIFWGMGISQHVHGTDNARCLIALALMCGQIGRPGTGLHPLRGQNNVQGASDVGLIPMVYPDYAPVGDPQVRARFEALWGSRLDPEPGLTVVEITEAIHAGDIRGLYIMGENPAMSDPNANHVRAALAKLEHLVVQDIFLTETAAFADVVLPASAFAEKDGSFTNTDRRVQIGRKALDPPGAARQDLAIIQDIAARLGLDWHYEHPRDVFAEMRRCMPSIKGITWERLEREGAVTYPCASENEPGHEILFGDGFPTPSGRGKFVPCAIIPPDEQPDADFPLILTTGRILEHWHTGVMTRRADVLDAIEPAAAVHCAPADLERWNIAPGARVRLSTRRGVIELATRASPAVPAGVLFMPFCFNEAAANLLTNDALDPFGKIAEVKFCAAKLEPLG
jgi:formate dehydrogenase major subunit